MNPRLFILCLGVLAATACGDTPQKAPPPAVDNTNNGGGKTDTPDDAPEDSCTKRRADALYGNQRVFTESAIRWSCADVEGVNNNNQDDRGQEYCEYFAIAQLPPEIEGGELPLPTTLGRISEVTEDDIGRLLVETTPLKIELTDDQIFYFEDNPDEIAGQCVFTSWHDGVPGEAPSCVDPAACPEILGVPLTANIFQMKLPTNHNEAASALVEDCLNGPVIQGDPANPDDPFHSDFYRGCIMTAELYGTEWRRSDPAVCAAVLRLRECGCALNDPDAYLPTALVPRQPQINEAGEEVVTFRGFPLGTWVSIDALPAGCRHAEVGDGSQTVVLCDLTAIDMLDHSSDLKRRCIEKYGDNVVVHVPIPASAISCSPPEGGPYSDTCSATPWVVKN